MMGFHLGLSEHKNTLNLLVGFVSNAVLKHQKFNNTVHYCVVMYMVHSLWHGLNN